jgi:hypothetical protein
MDTPPFMRLASLMRAHAWKNAIMPLTLYKADVTRDDLRRRFALQVKLHDF